MVDAAFADEQRSRQPLSAIPYSAVLTVERRVSKEGMISVGGNFYSVPDITRRRTLELQHHAEELRNVEDGQLITRHPILEASYPINSPRHHTEARILKAAVRRDRRSGEFYFGTFRKN